MESIREFLIKNGVKDGEPIIPIEGHELGSIMTAEHFLEYWTPRLERYFKEVVERAEPTPLSEDWELAYDGYALAVKEFKTNLLREIKS